MHESPSRYIQVPALIFKGQSAAAPPIVNLSGGPGQSWADLGLDQITAADTQSLPMDMVFLEQRGTGLARPRLDCPAQGTNESDTAFAARCGADLQAQGINVAAYNIQEMASDVATFQAVLGYPTLALDGVSYGTAWGLQILRAYSSLLDYAILDSVVNPTIPTLSASASATDSAMAATFAACASDGSCSGAYGDVESEMEAALPSLSTKPLTLAGTTTQYDDSAMFEDAVTVLALAPPLLPRMIAAVTAAIANGSGQLLYDSDVSATIGNDTQVLSSLAIGQYFSVLCTDNQFVTLADAQSDLAKVNPAFAPYLDNSPLISICQAWKYPRRTLADYAAVTSAVTTLLVSGSLDPLTSPSWARQASTTLSNGYWVEFPGLGHDVGASTDRCPEGILSQFLLSPGAPNTNCVGSMSIAFAPPVAPATVVVNEQVGARLADAGAAKVGLARPGSLYQQVVTRSRVDNLLARRHLRQRVAELTWPAR
jgi:pimeloyl-ACP methyl ester carboxylesterase